MFARRVAEGHVLAAEHLGVRGQLEPFQQLGGLGLQVPPARSTPRA